MPASECAGCGASFSSVSAFDRHQTAGDGSFGSVTCHEPASRGLVLNSRGRWGFPQNTPFPHQRADGDGSEVPGGTEVYPPEHEPSDSCRDTCCCIHHVDEPEPEGGAFKRCFECKHCYATEADLVGAFNTEMTRIEAQAAEKGWAPIEFVPVQAADQIWFCPFCTHDF